MTLSVSLAFRFAVNFITICTFLSLGGVTAMTIPTPTTSGKAASTFIDKLALILVRQRKQLVVRSKGKTAFFTPGGKREPGETDLQALCRECREELTIHLNEPTIRPYGVFSAPAFGKPPGTEVRMTCYTAEQYQGELQAAAEIEELQWITSDFDPQQLSASGILILKDLKDKDLID